MVDSRWVHRAGVAARRRLKRPSRTASPRPGERSTDGPDDPLLADVELVAASPLFDPDWYALQAGVPPERGTAARHYLEKGAGRGHTPHPLFLPRYFARSLPEPLDSDPFVAFLRDASLRGSPTHPLFDVVAYVEAHPTASGHAWGPLGHYLELGARSGLHPNRWYVPRPEDEPEGVADWIRERGREWRRRHDEAAPTWVPEYDRELAGRTAAELRGAPLSTEPEDHPTVSIIVAGGFDHEALQATLRSVRAQTLTSWEVLLLAVQAGTPDSALLPDVAPGRLRVIRAGAIDAAAMNVALSDASGSFVTWVFPGETWEPDRLHLLVAASRRGVHGAHDIVRARTRRGRGKLAGGRFDATRLRGHARPFLSQLLVAREAALSLEPFDTALPNGWEAKFAYHALTDLDLRYVPVAGTLRDQAVYAEARRLPELQRPPVDHAETDTWHDVVINAETIDWDGLAASPRDPSTVSVVIPTYRDWGSTLAAVQSIAAAGAPPGTTVEVVVLDNGCPLPTATILDSAAERFDNVTVIHSPVNHGFALGNNVALPHTTGGVLLFLNNDTTVTPGWLDPLVARLKDPEVLGAQSLLVYPEGLIQSAGIAFPDVGGVPHPFLQGFPVQDAQGAASLCFSALTGAALAVRFDDFVTARGFDPLFRNGMEDIDLCLRLKAHRAGHFAVAPSSVVTHQESRSPGRFKHALENRRLYLDRWSERAPRDDTRLWAAAGFDVVGHEIRNRVTDELRICVPEPVLARRGGTAVSERAPRLRWAIKIPSPAGSWAEGWGDTHFARSLASALRELGQDVFIDHRESFARESGRFDDVALVLRGLEPFRPAFGQVSLAWLISHPEDLSRAEASDYDRLFSASHLWAEGTSKRWRIRVDPLLQATDPAIFNPDRAQPDSGDPVVFVGGSRKHFRPIIEQALAAGLPLAVYGSGWEDFIATDLIKATHVENDRIGALYRSAGVVLNDHWESMRTQGFISNRLFDAVAAGARVITDDVCGLEGLFGRSVQVAATPDDLARLADPDRFDETFGDDAERRAVAHRIHEQHSFAARARTLLDTALEIRSRQSAARRA